MCFFLMMYFDIGSYKEGVEEANHETRLKFLGGLKFSSSPHVTIAKSFHEISSLTGFIEPFMFIIILARQDNGVYHSENNFNYTPVSTLSPVHHCLRKKVEVMECMVQKIGLASVMG